MTYPYPGSPVVLSQLIVDKITAAIGTFTPAVTDVMYGDQDRIPTTPFICVETGDKTRTLQGVSNMTLNEFEVFIIIYHNKLQNNETTRKEVDQIAYQVEQLLHQDLQLKDPGNGNAPTVIHGFVTRTESGFTAKGNTLYRSARLTWSGKNKTSLPVA